MKATNSFLVPVESMIPAPVEGHQWAQPSLDELKVAMRLVFEERKEVFKSIYLSSYLSIHLSCLIDIAFSPSTSHVVVVGNGIIYRQRKPVRKRGKIWLANTAKIGSPN